MKSFMLGILLVVSVPGWGLAQEPAVEVVKVGGKELKVPIPKGFAKTTGVSAQYDEISESYVPDINRLIIKIEPTPVRDALAEGREIPVEDNRGFSIQVLRQLEHMDVSPADFDAIKAGVRRDFGPEMVEENVNKALEKGNDKLRELDADANVEVEVEVTKVGQVGLLKEEPNYITFAVEAEVQSQVAGDDSKEENYIVCSAARVEGTVIFLYCNTLSTFDERAWATKMMEEWVVEILDQNDPLKE